MLLLILAGHLFLLANTRFTLWPEMVVYPYLLNNNFILYKDIINPYPPTFTYFLSLFANLFGYQPLPYQILTWSIILIVDLLIFLLARKFFNKVSYGYLALLFFVIFSIPFGVNGLWFDLIQAPLILGAVFYFIRFLNETKQNQKDFFFALFFLIIAFFIKQQVVWIGFLFFVILALKLRKNFPQFLLANSFSFLPFIILMVFQLVVFSFKNSLEEFVFWTLYFPFFKASQMPGYVDFPSLRQLLIVLTVFLIFIPTILRRNDAKSRLLILFGLATLLFAYPRFDYFHLVPTLAILAIAFGQNLINFWKSSREIKIICVASLILLSAFTMRYILRNWTAEVRFFEKDILQAAIFLQKITLQDDLVYIQNGPDQVLPLANRLPPKPWADEFPWYLELSDVQDKIVPALNSQNPKLIIYKPYEKKGKYEIGGYRPQKIGDYIDQNYQNLFQISDTLWLKVVK